MDVWQGVAVDFLKFHPGPPCPTFLCPAGGRCLRPSSSPLVTPRRTPTEGISRGADDARMGTDERKGLDPKPRNFCTVTQNVSKMG
jgi:hypothetical protein